MSNVLLNSGKAWQVYFNDVGLTAELVEEYTLYAEKLTSKKVPVIFDWHHLAALMGVSTKYLVSVVNASPYHYREFSIPKKTGGVRIIQAPRAALKECQRWILKNILSRIAVHSAAKGFASKKSIKDHAAPHVGLKPTLKMDFKDFFPSIKKRRVISLFSAIGYSKSVSLYLASICCLAERLPQGASTSPAISNIVCRSFDGRMSALARKRRWKYSRYADDLAISGEDVEFSLSFLIKRIARDEGFDINAEKTKFYPEGINRVITGVAVGKDSLGVPRGYRRDLSKDVYYVAKFGVLSHVAKTKKRHPLLLESLKGRLGFWEFIDPTDKKVDRLRRSLDKIKVG